MERGRREGWQGKGPRIERFKHGIGCRLNPRRLTEAAPERRSELRDISVIFPGGQFAAATGTVYTPAAFSRHLLSVPQDSRLVERLLSL